MLKPPLFDSPLAGTPFRGLIIHGFVGLCAYIGVPNDHWMAEMDELVLQVHGSITFRGPGGDGYRAEGWYWWGWDYQHASDYCEFPDEIQELIPPELAEIMKSLQSHGKKWTVAEVEQDLIDAAVDLNALVLEYQESASRVVEATSKATMGAPGSDAGDAS